MEMIYSVTPKPYYKQHTKPSNKQVHPYIMKSIENKINNNNNNSHMFPMMNLKYKNLILKNKNKNINTNKTNTSTNTSTINNNIHNVKTKTKSKSINFSLAPQMQKTFLMNLSELSTGKPCGSCGGR